MMYFEHSRAVTSYMEQCQVVIITYFSKDIVMPFCNKHRAFILEGYFEKKKSYISAQEAFQNEYLVSLH